MTDFEKFTRIYRSIGVDTETKKEGKNITIIIRQDSAKCEGYDGFYTCLLFDEIGVFISQGFWE